MRTLFLVIAYTCVVLNSIADDKILIQAKVNGNPVRLAFDTGSEATWLFKRAAERLNLTVNAAPSRLKSGAGKVKLGLTSEAGRFTLGGQTITAKLPVLDTPKVIPIHIDGLLAWNSLKRVPLQIKGAEKKIIPLDGLPGDLSSWTKWKINESSRLLAFYPSEAKAGLVYIDTGSPYGVGLNNVRWEQWIQSRPNAPRTLMATYWPAEGIVVSERRAVILDKRSPGAGLMEMLSSGALLYSRPPHDEACPNTRILSQPF